MNHIRVIKNLHGNDREEHPWHVTCDLCVEQKSSFLGFLPGTAVKGWASTHAAALTYAIKHAQRHERTRCGTCSHLPKVHLDDLPKTDAQMHTLRAAKLVRGAANNPKRRPGTQRVLLEIADQLEASTR